MGRASPAGRANPARHEPYKFHKGLHGPNVRRSAHKPNAPRWPSMPRGHHWLPDSSGPHLVSEPWKPRGPWGPRGPQGRHELHGALPYHGSTVACKVGEQCEPSQAFLASLGRSAPTGKALRTFPVASWCRCRLFVPCNIKKPTPAPRPPLERRPHVRAEPLDDFGRLPRAAGLGQEGATVLCPGRDGRPPPPFAESGGSELVGPWCRARRGSGMRRGRTSGG